MRIKLVTVSILVLMSLSLSACVTTPQASYANKSVASFDYTPPSFSSAGSAGMKIILVNPKFAEGFGQSGVEPYASFAESMANDFQEVLSSLGYTVFGPYSSYDEIVYSEKEVADVLLNVDIDMTQAQSLTKKQKYSLGGIMLSTTSAAPEPKYSLSGDLSISGKLTLKAKEPQSAEQMWTKSLEIDPKSFTVNSTQTWTDRSIVTGKFMADAGIHNPAVAVLNEIYADVMSKSHTYLDPRELRLLRAQIERIKSRIRY